VTLTSVDLCDGDLVRRARVGDAGAFALLIERRFGPARALAARLGAHPDDVDDIVQEAFLQAFAGLDRLRDPDRFGAWLAGIVRNVSRAAARKDPLTLLADWPEDLHPVSGLGLPSAENLDRAEVLRAAIAGLPGGQRRAVELYYFADLPAGQIGPSPAAAKASLHKARRRLREQITARRPDLIPAVSRRITMTTIRIAHLVPHSRAQPDGTTHATRILVVLADDRGRRAMSLWLPARHGQMLSRVLGRPASDAEPPAPPERQAPPGDPVLEFTSEDLAVRLLSAAGAAVTGADIDELGPGVLAARVAVTGPAGTRQVTMPPAFGLALAIAQKAPIRVADALMDKLAVPVAGDELPWLARRPPVSRPDRTPGPRNLDFADGLDGWDIGGRSQGEVAGAYWDYYTVAAADGTATLSAKVPQPRGIVFLGQAWIAGDDRGATVTLRAEISAQGVAGHAELSLFTAARPEEPVSREPEHGQREPVPKLVRQRRDADMKTIAVSTDWTRYELAAQVPADAEEIGFEITLAGPGKVGLRDVALIHASEPG
jgi:RNA polymerase sigma-70 factor, ECF subfamily